MMPWLITFLIILHVHVVHANSGDIPPLYQIIAKEQRVPAKLFYALILNESRSKVNVSDGRNVLPWPWTINHRGKPYYFNTRQQAYNYMRHLLNIGEKSFDVGFGQINWKWHNHRFESDIDILDPHINLTTAAKILREQFDREECNRWELAVGCYHRPGQTEKDKKIANQYMKKVITLWLKI